MEPSYGFQRINQRADEGILTSPERAAELIRRAYRGPETKKFFDTWTIAKMLRPRRANASVR